MRKRYVVETVVAGVLVREGFTKSVIDQLKSLNIIRFTGTTRTREGRIFEYVVTK